MVNSMIKTVNLRSLILLSILSLIILSMLLLTACQGIGGKNTNSRYNPEYEKYFQGYDGVSANFENFPNKLYYYAGNPNDASNHFDFSVRVNNDGVSFTRGAVFVSGYSPKMVEIDQIPIGGASRGACSLRLSTYSLNQLGAMMTCGNGFQWSGHEGNWLDSIKISGKTWFKNNPLLSDMVVNYVDSNQGFGDVQLSWGSVDYVYRERGQLLIALMAGLNFQMLNGQEFLLAGDTYEYPGGEIDYIDYNARIANWPQGLDYSTQSFMLTTCYLYTTYVAEDVCIDPQPYSENKKVCQAKTRSWTKGQGSPVAITNIEQENTPTKSIFRFTVSNAGGGTVYDPGQLEKCSPYHIERTSPSDLNTIWIGEVRIGNVMLDCNPEHFVKLDPRTGKATFTCSYSNEYVQLKSAYYDTLTTELWYGYSKSLTKDVIIKRVQ